MPIWPGVAKALIRTGLAQKLPSIRKVMGEELPYLRYYSRRILGSPNVELKATQAMLEEADGAGAIDLTIGAPDFHFNGPADVAAPAGYPPVSGMPELRQAIAEKLHVFNGLDCDPDGQVLVCNGVSQAISLMLDTFVERRGSVAVFDPTFFIYRLAAQNREIRVRQIPTRVEEGRTQFRETDLRKAIRGATVLFVNTPSNPTGGLLDEATLDRVAYWCRRHDVLIFADEVYERFVYEGRHVSIASLPLAAERTVTANSFSKSYGMAGARVGYVAGPRGMIQPMVVTLLAAAPFVSTQSQLQALAALRTAPEWFEREWLRFRNRRDYVAAQLSRSGADFVFPPAAFFFWINAASLGVGGTEFAHRLLREEGVLVLPGDSSGKSGADYVRISFAGLEQPMREGVRRLVDAIGRQANPRILPIDSARMQRKAG